MDRRTGGGEGVGQDVVIVDPVPAIRLHPLKYEARLNCESIVWREGHRHSSSNSIAGVDVIIHAQVRLDAVDEAGDAIVIADHAERRCIAYRRVDAELDVGPAVTAIDKVSAELGEALGHAQLRLVGDVTYGSRQRARAEQSALGAAQNFDAVYVE